MAGLFDLEENARRIGHYRWAELRLFEALGSWTTTVPEPEVAPLLGAHCHHHAWHAELWSSRLPELRHLDPDRLTAPPNDAMERFVAALTEPEHTIERLVGAYRVLIPHLVAAYEFHRDHTSEATDAPTIRAITLVLRDELADLHDAEALLRTLLRVPDDMRRASDHQARLEQLLVEAGGVAGPGTTGTTDTR